ncbi:MAG: thiamine phosphate synthase [Gemmatimonadota bacterium]
MDPSRLRLVVITDAAMAAPRRIEDVVGAALEAGAPAIQLREKGMGARELVEVGRPLRRLTRRYGALFIANDRVDVALVLEADGVHLGPDDLPVSMVRRVTPPGFLIGYSTDDPDEARRAEREGADYLGVGTVWKTESKAHAGEAIGPEGLARVASTVSIPVVGIGGIHVERAPLLAGSGAAGIAVIGAVMGAPDPGMATEHLLRVFGNPSTA